jgi:hypothetical protein
VACYHLVRAKRVPLPLFLKRICLTHTGVNRKQLYYDKAAEIASQQLYFTRDELDREIKETRSERLARSTQPAPGPVIAPEPIVPEPAPVPGAPIEDENVDTQEMLADLELLTAAATKYTHPSTSVSPHAKDKPEPERKRRLPSSFGSTALGVLPYAADAVDKLCDGLDGLQRSWDGFAGANTFQVADYVSGMGSLPDRNVRRANLINVLAEPQAGSEAATNEGKETRTLRRHMATLFSVAEKIKFSAVPLGDILRPMTMLFDTHALPWMPRAPAGEVELVDAIAIVHDDGLDERFELLRQVRA